LREARPAMRWRATGEAGERRWVKVGRAERRVVRGSRQAPPWM
jgi:hypothetical protein